MIPRSHSFSMSLMWPVSMNNFIETSLALNRIGEFADAFDFHRDRVAGGERTDAFGGAGGDDVARLERHHEGDELDQVLDRKDQMSGARRLAPLAVDESFDAARVAVQAGGDARADRRKRVEALAARVLRFFLLQIARGDVVDADQAANVVPRVLAGDAVGAAADDDAELGFVIDAADAGRNANRIARTDHGARRLDEQQRLGRQRLADFTGVILVVEADTDDLRRHHRRQQPDRAQAAGDRRATRQRGERIARRTPQLAIALDREHRPVVLTDAEDAFHQSDILPND